MSGYIGKWLSFFSRGTRKIKRITGNYYCLKFSIEIIFLSGLDPAKPLWYHNLTSLITYIHKDDAEVN